MTLLGKGGMGTVYLGIHKRTGRKEVLKILHSHLAGDPQCSKRFQREARNLAAIDHINIVRCYGTHLIGNTEALVMEFVEGQTLKALIEKGGALQWERAVGFTRQILTGMIYLHSAGILHRDLKLDNVMLTSTGTLKIVDLGIAIAELDETLTRTGWLTGTPKDIAPEVLNGKKFDTRADIRSVGLCLYELVTGTAPFRGSDTTTTMRLICEGVFPAPKSINAAIPEWLNQIILKAMATNPDDRFQTANAFLAALCDHVDPAVIPTPAPSSTPWATVPAMAAVAAAVAFAFLCGMSVAYHIASVRISPVVLTRAVPVPPPIEVVVAQRPVEKIAQRPAKPPRTKSVKSSGKRSGKPRNKGRGRQERD